MLTLPGWTPNFATTSPMFDPLRHLADYFVDFESWPGLADYQSVLDNWPAEINTQGGAPLKIAAQAGRPDQFEQHYAPRIYLTGEIQTRTENWHDFFQYLSWFMFPTTKAVINAIHLPYAKARLEEGGAELGRRSPVENLLSLFDEGGAVLISSDPELLQLVRDFQWKELFWHRRDELADKFKCVAFGHAMYEKGMAPYLGMTANCILLDADERFFQQNNDAQLAWVDEQLAEIFSKGERLAKPRDLSPFPILGMPGWDAQNDDEAYYDNVSYFRPGRRGKKTQSA
ncbi:DUF3025 domain-containing protein [Pseudomonadota bacterium]